MDKIEELRGKGFLTKIKNKVIPAANKIMGSIIPGYDYREKKKRLYTDQSVREKLSRELSKSQSALKEVSKLAYKDDKRDVIEHIKDVINTMNLFQAKIEKSSFGMEPTPFFSNERIQDSNIIRMIEFDASLLDDLEVITQATDQLYDSVLEGKTSDIITQLRFIKREIDKLENDYKNRIDFLTNLA